MWCRRKGEKFEGRVRRREHARRRKKETKMLTRRLKVFWLIEVLKKDQDDLQRMAALKGRIMVRAELPAP